jgi:hypothetical protein
MSGLLGVGKDFWIQQNCSELLVLLLAALRQELLTKRGCGLFIWG